MQKPANSKSEETEFERIVRLSGGPPTKQFTKKDERELLRMIHEMRKRKGGQGTG